MSKTYKLKTVEDIANAVTLDNVDRFVDDFRMWLGHVLAHRGTKKILLKGKYAYFGEIDITSLTWIDDGKHEGYEVYIDNKGKSLGRKRVK